MTWIVEQFLSVLAKFWREALIIFLLAALWLTTSHFKTVTVELEDDKTKLKIQLAQQEQSFAIQVALAKEKENEATRTYAASVATLQASHAVAVKDLERVAYKNFMARFGLTGFTGDSRLRDPNATGVRIPVPTSTPEASQDASAFASYASRSSEFVAACANDALRLNEWIRLCELNQCEVVE